MDSLQHLRKQPEVKVTKGKGKKYIDVGFRKQIVYVPARRKRSEKSSNLA